MLAGYYVKASVTNVEERLIKDGRNLPSKCATLFYSNYSSWLEESPELKVDGLQRFQELIGHICWVVEIGHIDILL